MNILEEIKKELKARIQNCKNAQFGMDRVELAHWMGVEYGLKSALDLIEKIEEDK